MTGVLRAASALANGIGSMSVWPARLGHHSHRTELHDRRLFGACRVPRDDAKPDPANRSGKGTCATAGGTSRHSMSRLSKRRRSRWSASAITDVGPGETGLFWFCEFGRFRNYSCHWSGSCPDRFQREGDAFRTRLSPRGPADDRRSGRFRRGIGRTRFLNLLTVGGRNFEERLARASMGEVVAVGAGERSSGRGARYLGGLGARCGRRRRCWTHWWPATWACPRWPARPRGCGGGSSEGSCSGPWLAAAAGQRSHGAGSESGDIDGAGLPETGPKPVRSSDHPAAFPPSEPQPRLREEDVAMYGLTLSILLSYSGASLGLGALLSGMNPFLLLHVSAGFIYPTAGTMAVFLPSVPHLRRDGDGPDRLRLRGRLLCRLRSPGDARPVL